MSNRRERRNKLFVRIMALVLAAIMVGGVAYYLILLIGGN